MTGGGWWSASDRRAGLRRFAVAITLLNVLGHTVLGFEQSWAQPLVALATAYGVELLLEVVEAWAQRRRLQFAGGTTHLIDFLLSAHISALAVSMLLYANERLLPIAFAAAVALGSKAIFRTPPSIGSRHFLNPSNFGISVTLLLFPSVSVAPPYQFTENTSGVIDWLLPGLIVVTGTLINARFTHRLPLIAAWLAGFIAQAVLRTVLFGTPLAAALMPMTGLAFVLYTFYMVTDPATTPSRTRAQVAFGAGVATVYGLLVVGHAVFGLFFALTIVCLMRGALLHLRVLVTLPQPAPVFVGPTVVAGERRP
jgi:hypothetical protein